MEFNDKLHNKYDSFQIYFDIINIYRKDKKFLLSIYDNTGKILILRSEYIFLGTYSKLKNFWMWSDQSFTLDKSMVNKVNSIRKTLLNKNISDEIKEFIKKNYTIMSTIEYLNYCKSLDSLLKNNILIYNNTDSISDIILITKIINNNIK